MIGFLKILKGYVRIKVWGFSPERFMNLCGNRDILLWDIVKEGDVYSMCISLRSFYKLRPIVKKTGTRVVVLQRYGLPFFIPFLIRRKVFVLGLVLAVSFWFASAFFIWDIQVSGNYQISDDSFTDFLNRYQVKVGMKKQELNIEELEKEIRRTFPQVTWTSARLSGTKLLIEVKENDAPILATLQEQEEGADLISEYEGTIVSIIVRKGVPKVKIGDTVEKDTVLVEGSVPVFNEDATVREYQYVNADADIILEHTRKFRGKLPFDYVSREYTGRTKKSHFLRIGEKKIGIPGNRPFLVYDSVIKESRPLLFEKLSIPVYRVDYTYREYQDKEHEYTLKEAKALLLEKCNRFLTSLDEKGVQIIEKNVKIDTRSGAWIVEGDFLVRESVGVSVTVLRQDTGENNADE